MESIRPYLEPTCSGPSALWAYQQAARLQCLVSIGYPERTPDPTSIPSKIPFNLTETVSEVCASIARKDTGKEGFETSTEYWNYNASLIVDPEGNVVAHYRKSFLYYTDASWSLPSPTGFATVSIQIPFSKRAYNAFSSHSSAVEITAATAQRGASISSIAMVPEMTKVAFGICMDLNPQYFTAPWDKRELATHVLGSGASLLLINTAWMTRLPATSGNADSTAIDDATTRHDKNALSSVDEDQGPVCCPPETSQVPDLDSIAYWLDRLLPLIQATKETTVVIANRVGVEAGLVKSYDLQKLAEENTQSVSQKAAAELTKADSSKDGSIKRQKENIEVQHNGAEPTAEFTRLVDADEDRGIVSTSAHYAGSSVVLKLGQGEVEVYGMLGRGNEGVLVADTKHKAEVYWRIDSNDDEE